MGWDDPYFQPVDARLLTQEDLNGGRTTPDNTATRGGHKDRLSGTPRKGAGQATAFPATWPRLRPVQRRAARAPCYPRRRHPAQTIGTDGMAVWLSADAAHLKDD